MLTLLKEILAIVAAVVVPSRGHGRGRGHGRTYGYFGLGGYNQNNENTPQKWNVYKARPDKGKKIQKGPKKDDSICFRCGVIIIGHVHAAHLNI